MVATSLQKNMPRASGVSSMPTNGINHVPSASPASHGLSTGARKDNGHMSEDLIANGQRSKRNILDLATEQLEAILRYLEDDPEKSIRFDRRAYLSRDSFRQPPPSITRARDLANFRETCRRFADVGASLQYEIVTIRFSVQDFERLDKIASKPHLASRVRKFSYLVPCFFVPGKDRVQEVLPSLTASLGRLDHRYYQQRVFEQNAITQSNQDQRILLKALQAFTGLQHVQILRSQDMRDEELVKWLRYNGHIRQYLEFNWHTACSHSTRTIGEALLGSHSPCWRFSSPFLEPQSAISLVPSGTFTKMVSKLRTIELNFGDGSEDLDVLMRELAPMFRAAFAQSVPALESIHIGFPRSRPISLPLEDLFHGVTWKNLACFGIQGWKLHADEIIAITSRHRTTLRGLRLRDVLLKEDSRWKDVLPHIRDNLTRLKWCSLRRIGYVVHFDEMDAAQGGDISDFPMGILSDSDSEHEDNDGEDTLSINHTGEDTMSNNHTEEDMSSNNHAGEDLSSNNLIGGDDTSMAESEAIDDVNGDLISAASSNAEWPQSNGYDSDQDGAASITHSERTDDEHGMASVQMGFPSQIAPNHNVDGWHDTPSTVLWCNCSNQSIQIDLEHAGPFSDDGVHVAYRTWKVWEKWVIGRCPLHDPTPS